MTQREGDGMYAFRCGIVDEGINRGRSRSSLQPELREVQQGGSRHPIGPVGSGRKALESGGDDKGRQSEEYIWSRSYKVIVRGRDSID
jgi:hypothetical protein